ncbi:hypothetical protein Mkiyose1385_14470 [Mycobacterium kiyosense]|uniref:Uncharacterized protein n=1 Tax=Mycobacterium kiyosense TaxID=2871094 RepID=A0AA37UZK0_9MYCO|nr:hypothetical protein SRL2020028_33040 [Mycobacterium kiyosense]GLC10550.1 hypothetical protein SRL2020411_51960 [Mycobacterium kiyosense]GLD17348.1 hypothetical protein Mkiyose1385_14470 [Mycobacterium kiyosense]
MPFHICGYNYRIIPALQSDERITYHHLGKHVAIKRGFAPNKVSFLPIVQYHSATVCNRDCLSDYSVGLQVDVDEFGAASDYDCRWWWWGDFSAEFSEKRIRIKLPLGGHSYFGVVWQLVQCRGFDGRGVRRNNRILNGHRRRRCQSRARGISHIGALGIIAQNQSRIECETICCCV